jgi:hypothetical protein
MSALLANPALPGLIASLSNPSCQAIGMMGEQIVYHMLASAGYIVSNTHPGEQRADLRVITPHGEVLRVEVKTARKACDGKWHFTLRKKGKTDHSHSDVVILLCVMLTGFCVPFVIPTARIVHQQQACINSDPYRYKGKFARFRQPLHKLSLEVRF